MKHSPEELDRLQALLTRSIAQAGEHLRRTFELPDHALSAAQLARYLDQPRGVALATVTAKGEPRVAPVASVFYRAAFHIPTTTTAARATHVRSRPAVSLTHWVSDVVSIIGHGSAAQLPPEHPDVAALDQIYRPPWWLAVRERQEGIYLRVEAAVLYTWAREPGEFPA